MELFNVTDTALFRGVTEDALPAVIDRLQARIQTFPRGGVICRAGEPVRAAGLLLSGEAHIEHSDFWGNQSILAGIGPGELFAEVYACMPGASLLVSVTAVRECRVLFLDIGRIISGDAVLRSIGAPLEQNLLRILAGKNLALTRKIHCTAPRSIRSRVLTYLSFQAIEHGGISFDIPFHRQHMADYLCVDRSSLSAELSRMQKDGLLEYSKNHFTLHAAE